MAQNQSIFDWLRQVMGQGGQQSNTPYDPNAKTGTANQKRAGVPSDAPWGTRNIAPGTDDIFRAMQEDWQLQNRQKSQDYNRRLGALNELGGFVGGMGGQGRRDLAKAQQGGLAELGAQWKKSVQGIWGGKKEALAQYESAIGTLMGERDKAIGDVQTGLSESRKLFRESTGQLEKERAYLGGALERVYETGASAMGEFRNQMTTMMSGWSAGQEKRVGQMKENRAAQMRQAGFRPEEIQQEMSKLDWDAGVERAQQMSAFSVEEETSRRDLQMGYDQLSTGMEGTVAQMRTALQEMEQGAFGQMREQEFGAGLATAEMRQQTAAQVAAMRDMQAQTSRWAADAERAVRMGAAEAGSSYRLGIEQQRSALNMMSLNGYQGWAGMQQDLGQDFVPYSSVLMSIFGTNLMMQDRNYGYEGSGLSILNTGMGMWQGFTNQMTGTLANV